MLELDGEAVRAVGPGLQHEQVSPARAAAAGLVGPLAEGCAGGRAVDEKTQHAGPRDARGLQPALVALVPLVLVLACLARLRRQALELARPENDGRGSRGEAPCTPARIERCKARRSDQRLEHARRAAECTARATHQAGGKRARSVRRRGGLFRWPAPFKGARPAPTIDPKRGKLRKTARKLAKSTGKPGAALEELLQDLRASSSCAGLLREK